MSDVWLQIISDVLGRPLSAMRDPQDAGARGTAACVLVGLGRQKDFAFVKRDAPVEKVYEPSPASRERYERGYATFKQLYERLDLRQVENQAARRLSGASTQSPALPVGPASVPAPSQS